jgi:predicted dehydrogenase
VEALSEVDAEAVVIDGDPAARLENVMAALAADLHVLVYPPLAPDDEDVHRCAFIALNRGVRLMIADGELHPNREQLAEAFRDYALEGVEPPSSARRWLARAAEIGGSE